MKAGKRGGESPGYEEWSKKDLQNRAKRLGIEGRSKMNKGELIDALRNHLGITPQAQFMQVPGVRLRALDFARS